MPSTPFADIPFDPYAGKTKENRWGTYSDDTALRDQQILDRGAKDLYVGVGAADAQSQASRGMQMAALAQQYAAAQGNGPSAAAAQQQQMGGQAMLGALANRSMGAASSGLGAVAQQSAATRASEMQQAMGGYGEGTGQLRGADQAYQQGAYNLANAQNQINLTQAQQNQSYLQGREQHQFDVGLALTNDARKQWQLAQQKANYEQQRKTAMSKAILNAAMTIGTAGLARGAGGDMVDAGSGGSNG